MVAIATKSDLFLSKIEFPSILVARQRSLYVMYFLSITLLQNIANIMFGTNGEIKGIFLHKYLCS